MGMFSWLTANGESIANHHQNVKPCKPVYLLRPGEPSICEPSYDGYGIFGGVDAYEWLSQKNLGITNRSLGIFLECGRYYRGRDGVLYICKMHCTETELKQVLPALCAQSSIVEFDNYGAPLIGGQTANDFIESGQWETLRPKVDYPLKFSFDPEDKYEDVPAAQTCPNQGYFF
ncbi:MAG: hypothetical protein GJ680_07505 [Alteromonadaceae bacterium]|nr:hypothetical protein [Alteromonadaceae bacterium]